MLTKDRGFMGPTHALSAAAVFLALIAFVPEFAPAVGITTASLMATWVLVAAGSSLVPDLDNTSATAKSTLGILGEVLSTVFRGSSEVLQRTIRTRRDDRDPDPHRGFWHTIPACFLLGAAVLGATQLGGEITVPIFGAVSWGWLAAFLVTLFNIQMALAGLFKKLVKKIKQDTLGEVAFFGIALILSGVLFWFNPRDQNFWWLGVAVALGAFIHIVGDTFTTSGTPIFFPLSYFFHKKFWWKTRLTPMKAGGTVENFVLVPIFILVIIVSLVKLFMS